MEGINLSNNTARIQGTDAVMIASETHAIRSELPLCCECSQRPRQPHCVLCLVCETLARLTKDHRDPTTIET